jgi:DNA-directed RNA polymerase subunit alpha
MIKPNFKLTTSEIEKNRAEVVIEPLPQNFGHTIGNALRRVLLTSLPGAAAVRVKIDGIDHQFTTLEGLKEDILELILNLKELRFVIEAGDSAKVKLNVKGEKVVTAADLELPAGVRLINPEHVLANLTSSKAKLSAVIDIETGFGYVSADKYATNEVGVIPLDASFSPILRVNYRIEATRVGRKTDLDKVILNITTNGAIEPETAVIESSKILSTFFTQVHNPVFDESQEGLVSGVRSDFSAQPVDDLDLPVRVVNALKKGGYKNISDLSSVSIADLVKVKNIGEKSAEDIIKKAKKRL